MTDVTDPREPALRLESLRLHGDHGTQNGFEGMPPLVSDTQVWALAVLRSVDEMAMVNVEFNSVSIKMPAGTLLTMAHCAHLIDQRLHFRVEAHHGNWMLDRVNEGDIFLDVGAATGASLLPIAIKKPNVRIIAFEPTIRASRLLRATLEANNITVELLNAAAFSANGIFMFREFKYDPEAVPYLTETSGIVDGKADDARAIYNQVPAVMIDGLKLKGQRIVMKIDVEGAEVDVLRGSLETLANNTVQLSIDIHEDKEASCREILSSFSYNCTMANHVLLCEKS